MKKVLIFCLILLCTLSVFAADVHSKVSLYFSYGSDGFGFSSNKGTWEPVIEMSVGGDYSGASFSWCPIDYKNSCYSFGVSFNPKDTVKFQVGANLSASFVKGFSLENLMAYGIINYDNLGNNGVVAQLGFGYQPESVKKLFNADVFIAGCFNYLNKEIGTFHFDGITKLNIENKKPSLDYSLSEISFNRFVGFNGETEMNECYVNENTDKIVAIRKQFNTDEAHYFDHESLDEEQDWQTSAFNTGFIAGLRYKYFTDADKSVYNGLYGYGLGSYALTEGEGEEKHSTYSFEAEAEVGRSNAELEIESRGTNGKFTEKVYSLYEFDWVNGKVEAALTDFFSWFKYFEGNYTPYIKINYENLKTNTAEENGIFFNPGFIRDKWTSNPIVIIDVGAKVGFNSLKNFKWNIQSSFTLNNY